MAATVVSTVTNLMDTGIGPVSIETTVYQGFDIDDYVHSTVIAQALQLRFINAAQNADPTLAANRTPVSIEGVTVGGY